MTQDWTHALTTGLAVVSIAAVSIVTLLCARESAPAIIGISIAAIAGLGGYHVARCTVGQARRGDTAVRPVPGPVTEKVRDA